MSRLGGVIKEVAQTRCGGEANLQAAIARGDCIETTHKGHVLFYFPEVTMGESESFVQEQDMSRTKATTHEAYQTVSTMIGKLGWTIRTHQKELEAFYCRCLAMYVCTEPYPNAFGSPHIAVAIPSPSQAGSASSTGTNEATQECLEKLNKAYTDMQKASKVATSLNSRAENLPESKRTDSLKAAHKQLLETMEATEKIHTDLGFLVKFKKSREQQPLTVPLAQEVVKMCACNLQNLIDTCKAMKAMLPKGD